jgi:hypothetical protein
LEPLAANSVSLLEKSGTGPVTVLDEHRDAGVELALRMIDVG